MGKNAAQLGGDGRFSFTAIPHCISYSRNARRRQIVICNCNPSTKDQHARIAQFFIFCIVLYCIVLYILYSHYCIALYILYSSLLYIALSCIALYCNLYSSILYSSFYYSADDNGGQVQFII